MKNVVNQDRQRYLYVHQCWGRLRLQSADERKWDGKQIVDSASPHPHLTIKWGNKSYLQGIQGPRRVMPLRVEYDGDHLAELDYHYRSVNSFHAKGHHFEDRADMLARYLSEITGQEVEYEVRASYVEACAFVERRHRHRLLGLCRHANTHFALAGTQKKVDKSYNGIAAEFISGDLQIAKGEPTFRLKFYEALYPVVGFKKQQAPKLEVQVRGQGTVDELVRFGEQILSSLLSLADAKTLSAGRVCIDKEGKRSYRRIIPDPFRGQGNRFMNELRLFEAVLDHEESFRWDERWPLYEAIYHRGLRNKKELISGGFTETVIRKALQSKQLIQHGAGGRAGNSYRVNFLPELTD